MGEGGPEDDMESLEDDEDEVGLGKNVNRTSQTSVQFQSISILQRP